MLLEQGVLFWLLGTKDEKHKQLDAKASENTETGNHHLLIVPWKQVSAIKMHPFVV